jgi:glycosyltransferase involved in cell wall biosynthesis
MLSHFKTYLRKQFPNIANWGRRFKSKRWPAGSIVYYTGNRKGGLTPLNLEKGTSGTDTAVISLCREWAKAGRDVTVFSNCEGKSGIYEGVRYVEQYLFNPYDKFDTLIILSHPYLLPLPVNASLVCWEWHDVLGSEKVYPKNKIFRFDKIFVKCQYQRNLLPEVPDEKFTIVTNGIDEKFTKIPAIPKEPFKLIYASRYYRGLDSMLEFGWPIVKSHIPEAELHIYHGWVRRELQSQHDNWRCKMEELFQQDGVFEHGRVSQEQLISEKMTASIHYYACTYPEIDCISVRESAAVGCVPVTTDFAVFKEKDYCVRVPGEPATQETQEAIAYRIIDLLKNPDELSTLRCQFKAIARKETWQEVAKVWLQTFDEM